MADSSTPRTAGQPRSISPPRRVNSMFVGKSGGAGVSVQSLQFAGNGTGAGAGGGGSGLNGAVGVGGSRSNVTSALGNSPPVNVMTQPKRVGTGAAGGGAVVSHQKLAERFRHANSLYLPNQNVPFTKFQPAKAWQRQTKRVSAFHTASHRSTSSGD